MAAALNQREQRANIGRPVVELPVGVWRGPEADHPVGPVDLGKNLGDATPSVGNSGCPGVDLPTLLQLASTNFPPSHPAICPAASRAEQNEFCCSTWQ